MEYQECRYGKCGNPVFATGICRKHYDKERLARAAPCSLPKCKAKAHTRGMCAAHYQAWRMKQTPICKIKNCSQHSRGKKYGLCVKHEDRMRMHGSTEQPRASDWGSREAHPLYQIFHWHKRASNLCNQWRNDFWTFVDVVGPDKPNNHTLRRKDCDRLMGPDNWHWKESYGSKDKADYARHWRARNARKAKNYDLKSMFGITIDDYDRMVDEQNGVCKICKKPETALAAGGGPSSLAVDHCHTTGKIRGLLCGNCNKGIGCLKDSPELLRQAALYIEANRSIAHTQ